MSFFKGMLMMDIFSLHCAIYDSIMVAAGSREVYSLSEKSKSYFHNVCSTCLLIGRVMKTSG